MNASFYVGLIAAVCIAVYMMPQLIKVLKTKDTSGISVVMFVIALLGDFFFVIDGILILCSSGDKMTNLSNGLPILLANAIAFTISFVIAYFKFRNMRRAKKMNLTEKVFCSNYKVNNEAYKLKYGKKKETKVESKPEGDSANIG